MLTIEELMTQSRKTTAEWALLAQKLRTERDTCVEKYEALMRERDALQKLNRELVLALKKRTAVKMR